MNANVGDHLVLRGHGSHGDDLRGEIVDIVGDNGSPPYVVRWPNGYSTLFTASPDAYIDPACGRTRLPRVDQPPLRTERRLPREVLSPAGVDDPAPRTDRLHVDGSCL